MAVERSLSSSHSTGLLWNSYLRVDSFSKFVLETFSNSTVPLAKPPQA